MGLTEHRPSCRESFALVKGAVLLLEDGDKTDFDGDRSPAGSPVKECNSAPDFRSRHIRTMYALLRPEDSIKLVSPPHINCFINAEGFVQSLVII